MTLPDGPWPLARGDWHLAWSDDSSLCVLVDEGARGIVFAPESHSLPIRLNMEEMENVVGGCFPEGIVWYLPTMMTTAK